MTTQQFESSKISYLKKLLKASFKERTLDSVNKAISYGEKHERSLERSNEIVLILNDLYDLKKTIIEWSDTCGRFAAEDYDRKRTLQRSLYEQGATNRYCLYR